MQETSCASSRHRTVTPDPALRGGFDFQVTDRIVAGVFADADFANIKGSVGSTYRRRLGADQRTMGMGCGGRVGYLILPAVLSYFMADFPKRIFLAGKSSTLVLNLSTFTCRHTLSTAGSSGAVWKSCCFLAGSSEQSIDSPIIKSGICQRSGRTLRTMSLQSIPSCRPFGQN
jgi:hypothetical protein